MEKLKKRLSVLFNIIIVIAAPAAWLAMMFALPEGPLSTRGIGSLRYFTVLSNMFAVIASVIYLINTRLEVREPSRWAALLKFVSAAAVGLTFFVVLLFLGPVYGYVKFGLYTGSNIWLHLIVPLLAMIDSIFLDNCPILPFKSTFFGAVPAAVYGVFYGGNLLINGVEGNDFYGFVMGGVLGSAFVGLSVLFACWLISLMIWGLKRRFSRKITKKAAAVK